MKNVGITRSGDAAERLLCEMTNNITKNEDKSSQGLSKGDNYFDNGKLKFAIEVKTNTLNQTRPYKYFVVVVYLTDTGEWVVLPPNVVARWASERNGQHCANSFECVGLGKPSKGKEKETRWDPYFVKPQDLEQKIVDAYLSGEKDTKVKNFCHNVATEIEKIAKNYKENFAKMMEEQ